MCSCQVKVKEGGKKKNGWVCIPTTLLRGQLLQSLQMHIHVLHAQRAVCEQRSAAYIKNNHTRKNRNRFPDPASLRLPRVWEERRRGRGEHLMDTVSTTRDDVQGNAEQSSARPRQSGGPTWSSCQVHLIGSGPSTHPARGNYGHWGSLLGWGWRSLHQGRSTDCLTPS